MERREDYRGQFWEGVEDNEKKKKPNERERRVEGKWKDRDD